VKPIAFVRSEFKEKFSIPRQPGLTSLQSKIEFVSPYNRAEAFTGLEGFSHVWVIFEFHQTEENDSLTVRPPRLGGNKRLGVFATRSPQHPNRMGLSVVKLIKIESGALLIEGGDFLDGTPVFDIKPYIKEIESIPEATSGWTAAAGNEKLEVVFDCDCDEKLKEKIVQVLSLDPRPRFHEDGYKQYGSRLGDVDVHWVVENNIVRVKEII